MQNTYIHSLFGGAKRTAATLMTALLFTVGLPETQAQGQGQGGGQGRGLLPIVLDIVPEITGISLNAEGELVASGNVTAEVRGQTVTSEFTDVPVNLSLAEDQTEAGACPILNLELDEINLNLLGLIVETSPICLSITAYDDEGLLGDLLCGVANLLSDGVPLDEILGGGPLEGLGLTDPLTGDLLGSDALLDELLAGVQDLLNEALGQLPDAILDVINHVRGGGRTCAILNLELGPLDLTLLGLNVYLDDCEGGPVTVDITAQRGQLLGNVLCGLLGGGNIDLGSTLQDIIDDLLGALN